MPVTTLDPKTALIVVDLQKGIFGMLQALQAELGETGSTAEILQLLEQTE